jgi:KipI family sensor histidine kinase inhibitor
VPDHVRVDGDTIRVLPCGDRALLVEVADLAAVAAVRSELERSPLAGQQELVPAARTVLVRFDRPPADADVAALRALRPAPAAEQEPGPLIEVAVTFDGPDLDTVAGLVGRPPARVVDDLVAAELTVAFSGFAPGFPYLTGLPAHLHVPRRATPRTRVPPGSVGLAGPFAGIYPRASPGGWQLVGRTDAVLFDVDRDPPALLRPGARVRLVRC